jgi:hypothetical protein
VLFPDEQVGWIRGAVETGITLLGDRPHQVILTSSPPESCHRVGARLARSTGLPWVADFRDPWAFSHLRAPSWLDRAHSRAEAWTLRRADAIVTVSEGWAGRFRERYPHIPCYMIRNGHDDRRLGRSTSARRFHILYTGKLDLDQQDPRPFLDGLRTWLTSNPHVDVEVTFSLYGEGAARAEEMLQSAALPQLRCTGPIDQPASLAAQAAASVLLLFAWRRDTACVPAKLYDYLAARRRVLVVGPQSSEPGRMVQELGVGTTATDATQVAAILASWYTHWATGATEPDGAEAASEAHSFEKRALEYERVLRRAFTHSRRDR